MTALTERVRRPTTFLLAVFLWVHALLFLNVHSPAVAESARLLRLTPAEAALVVLLLLFSLVTCSGFWRSLRSLLYVYAFPLVLLWYACYGSFLLLRAINRWFVSQTSPGVATVDIVVQNQSVRASQNPPPLVQPSDQAPTTKKGAGVLGLLVRPFRGATLLWCVLLLVSTHLWILCVSLGVILVQLARKVFRLLEVVLFSGPFFREAGQRLMARVDATLAGVDLVTRDSVPTAELKNLFLQVQMVEKVVRFLGNRDLVIRWAWLLTLVFLGGVYSYVAFLFSFIYLGVARIGGIEYSWPRAFVTSLFIPFFTGDLPDMMWAKLLGGVHCLLILTLGAGTIFTYIHRRLDSIRAEVTALSERLADQSIRERYLILEQKAAAVPVTKTTPGEGARAIGSQERS